MTDLIDRYAPEFRRAAARRSRRRALAQPSAALAIAGAAAAVVLFSGGPPEPEREAVRPPASTGSPVLDALAGDARPVVLSPARAEEIRRPFNGLGLRIDDAVVLPAPPPEGGKPWIVVPGDRGVAVRFRDGTGASTSYGMFESGFAYSVRDVANGLLVQGIVPDAVTAVVARGRNSERLGHAAVVRNAYRLRVPVDLRDFRGVELVR